ncbi:uncharacterized protein LOC129596072 [Paramacrobiotus metropolitanus]|uniref:uncharacterized protein LOC129596072 n=1 Tax=Paramacrobiotus metropolitanus TaxID=2943436 RepID=UPI002446209D|nr:uncharacterized protein LOC129596072 [Paramacrobiotus metropolitanus]
MTQSSHFTVLFTFPLGYGRQAKIISRIFGIIFVLLSFSSGAIYFTNNIQRAMQNNRPLTMGDVFVASQHLFISCRAGLVITLNMLNIHLNEKFFNALSTTIIKTMNTSNQLKAGFMHHLNRRMLIVLFISVTLFCIGDGLWWLNSDNTRMKYLTENTVFLGMVSVGWQNYLYWVFSVALPFLYSLHIQSTFVFVALVLQTGNEFVCQRLLGIRKLLYDLSSKNVATATDDLKEVLCYYETLDRLDSVLQNRLGSVLTAAFVFDLTLVLSFAAGLVTGSLLNDAFVITCYALILVLFPFNAAVVRQENIVLPALTSSILLKTAAVNAKAVTLCRDIKALEAAIMEARKIFKDLKLELLLGDVIPITLSLLMKALTLIISVALITKEIFPKSEAGCLLSANATL